MVTGRLKEMKKERCRILGRRDYETAAFRQVSKLSDVFKLIGAKLADSCSDGVVQRNRAGRSSVLATPPG